MSAASWRDRLSNAATTVAAWMLLAIILAVLAIIMLLAVMWGAGLIGDTRTADRAQELIVAIVGSGAFLVSLIGAIVGAIVGSLPSWVLWLLAILVVNYLLNRHIRAIVREELERRDRRDIG